MPVQHGYEGATSGGGRAAAEEAVGAGELKGLVGEIGKDMKNEFKTSVTRSVAENIATKTEETKGLAVALVTATLGDPDLPGKVAGIIKEFAGKPSVVSALSAALATSVVSTAWLRGLALPLAERQLDWWLVRDDAEGGTRWLRRELARLGARLVPSETVAGLAAWLLVAQLDPGEGSLKDPAADLAARALAWQVDNCAWAISENVHWCLRDEWYKEYARGGVKEGLRKYELGRKGK